MRFTKETTKETPSCCHRRKSVSRVLGKAGSARRDGAESANTLRASASPRDVRRASVSLSLNEARPNVGSSDRITDREQMFNEGFRTD